MSALAILFIPFDDVLEFSLPGLGTTDSSVTHINAGLTQESGRVFYTIYGYGRAKIPALCW